MRQHLLQILRCPFCLGELRQLKVLEESSAGTEYGLLNCVECNFQYPIVAGIPILGSAGQPIDIKEETDDRTLLRGPQVGEIVRLLTDGKVVEAFARLLNPLGAGGLLVPQLRPPGRDSSDSRRQPLRTLRQDIAVNGYRCRVQRRVEQLFRSRILPPARLRLARFLTNEAAGLSAMDALDLFYRRYSGSEMFHYFAYRFGQPRHLAALSLASLAASGEGPVLDLACGAGHLSHYLSCAHAGRQVVGVDRDFFRLFVAKRFVAPLADFVCYPGGTLPFARESFAAITCSDAFHYFLNRALCAQELLRVLSADGILVVTRFGNKQVAPNEGYELSVEAYERLFADIPHTFLAEDQLVDAYLNKTGPDLRRKQDAQELKDQKWLSVVASSRSQVFRDHGTFGDWPHAAGRLGINPIYVVERNGSAQTTALRLQFPSKWYEFENGRYVDYAPRQCEIPRELMLQLAEGRRTGAMEDYIKRFVIIGMPDHYLPTQLAPISAD